MITVTSTGISVCGTVMDRFSQLWASAVRPRLRRTPQSGRGRIEVLASTSRIAVRTSDSAMPAAQERVIPRPSPSWKTIAGELPLAVSVLIGVLAGAWLSISISRSVRRAGVLAQAVASGASREKETAR